jgi:hypothetical protein
VSPRQDLGLTGGSGCRLHPSSVLQDAEHQATVREEFSSGLPSGVIVRSGDGVFHGLAEEKISNSERAVAGEWKRLHGKLTKRRLVKGSGARL